jgi:Rha family phage regulatory protein
LNEELGLGLIEKSGKVVVSSRDIARVFEKRHADVMRDVRTILDVDDDFNQRNFALVEYTDAKGESRPEYLITRDGFTLLVMGYTGEKAMAFKKAYIEAFNAMEETLRAIPPSMDDLIKDPRRAIKLWTALAEAQEARLALSAEVEELKVELNESLEWWTIAKFSEEHGLGWNIKQTSAKGKQASKYCRKNQIEIRKCKTNDERFGTVNSYKLSVLEELFLPGIQGA